MNKSEFYEFFKKVPKAELHIHIEAVMSRDTIKKLYLKKNGVEFSDSEIKKLFSYSDLNGFIAAFLKVQDLFTSVSDFDLIFDDLKNYPSFESGYLVLKQNGRLNYLETNLFLKAFFESLTL